MVSNTLKKLYIDVLVNKYNVRMRCTSDGWVVILGGFKKNEGGSIGFYYLLSQDTGKYDIPFVWRTLTQ